MITIIVLLILAGISISMLSGDNGILQKATESKTNSEKQGIIEQARIDILGQQAENKGTNITKEQLVTILNKYFEAKDPALIPDEVSSEHDVELTTKDNKYAIKLSEIFKGRFASETIETIGEKYEDSMIGKTIQYTSGTNNVTDWIILGKQENAQGKNDVIITTKNPVSTQEIQYTLAEWTGYEGKINNACKNYVGQTGTLGTKSADIKEVRSITLDDINNAVGFNETINNITISNSNGGFAYPKSDGTGWIKNTDLGYTSWPLEETPIKEAYYYYNNNGTYKIGSTTNGFNEDTITLTKSGNMDYILANKTAYLVASRSVYVTSSRAGFQVAIVQGNTVDSAYYGYLCASSASGGNDRGGSGSMALRPCVVLSSEISWSDVESLIDSYATY